MENCRVYKTPTEKKLNLKQNCDMKTKFPYKDLLGSLMYIVMSTIADTCFSFSYFGKFQDSATDELFETLVESAKISEINYEL